MAVRKKPKSSSGSTPKSKRIVKDKVGKTMHELKHGELKSGRSGKQVKNPKQAIAIGLSEARRAGADVPNPTKKGAKKSVKKATKKTAAKKTAAKKTTAKKSVAKKAPAKKSAAKKTTAKKAPAKKATKKTAAKKS
jgi:hypothetical protein